MSLRRYILHNDNDCWLVIPYTTLNLSTWSPMAWHRQDHGDLVKLCWRNMSPLYMDVVCWWLFKSSQFLYVYLYTLQKDKNRYCQYVKLKDVPSMHTLHTANECWRGAFYTTLNLSETWGLKSNGLTLSRSWWPCQTTLREYEPSLYGCGVLVTVQIFSFLILYLYTLQKDKNRQCQALWLEHVPSNTYIV